MSTVDLRPFVEGERTAGKGSQTAYAQAVKRKIEKK